MDFCYFFSAKKSLLKPRRIAADIRHTDGGQIFFSKFAVEKTCHDMKSRTITYLQTYRSILRLGLPILIGQLGTIVVGFADNIMVGHYSTEALASASFVNNLFNCGIFACLGFTYGITPIVASLFSRNMNEEIGWTMRTALKLNVAFSLAVTLIMGLFYLNVERMGQPEELIPVIKPYFLIYLAGVVPVSVFNVFAQWSYAINNTRMPMWIILGANALNIIGNYMLIYGKCGPVTLPPGSIAFPTPHQTHLPLP